MYENSPEFFKKFQKRYKYNICETEPKLENTTIENYAYGYHSSATVIEGCTFGSNHYHVMYEFGSQDDNIFDSLCTCGDTVSRQLFQITYSAYAKRLC